MRRLVLTGALVAVALGGWWWFRPLAAPLPQLHRASAVAAAGRSLPSSHVPRSPVGAVAARGDRVRQSLVGSVVPAGVVGTWVRDAMARDGDSDPRLLTALAGLGLHPTWLSPAASVVDPWLAAGLLDLERQVADRCPDCGWDLTEPAGKLLADLPDDDGLSCVVRGVAGADPDACR